MTCTGPFWGAPQVLFLTGLAFVHEKGFVRLSDVLYDLVAIWLRFGRDVELGGSRAPKGFLVALGVLYGPLPLGPPRSPSEPQSEAALGLSNPL